MPLVVEDGTGIPGAESYLSVAGFDAHCERWGLDLTGRTTAEKETALRKAAAFIDTLGRYKGRPSRPDQGLEFPREGLVHWGGHPVTGLPDRLLRAVGDLAFKALTEPLQADLERGGRVRSESVGPISVTYADDAPAGKVFRLATELVAPYLRGEDQMDLLGPAWEPPGPPSFGFGIHDNRGGG